MAEDPDWRLLLPKDVREMPADLAVVVILTLATTLSVFLPVVKDTPLRVVLGLPFVLFLPGYAFVAALFPEEGESPVADDDAEEDGMGDRGSGIDGIERVALSFGLSIALVPLVGLVLNFTPFGIRLAPIVASLDLLVLGSVVVAANRRRVLEPDDRFEVAYQEWFGAVRQEMLEPASRADAVLNVVLVVSILVAMGSVTYAVAVPKSGEQFTEFYVLTEGEDGELVADGYPTDFVRGESKPIVVGMQNHEGETVRYSVVIEQQRVELVDNGTNVSVLEETELQRYSTQVEPNGTAMRNVSLEPTMTGERQRVVFLLYKEDVPAEPTVNNSYRELHLWVNVSAGNSSIVELSGTPSELDASEIAPKTNPWPVVTGRAMRG
ncbi:DUF1616 domain-containing protein [Haloarchaeobius sp. HME9146]|uniref:DUF1616 domain-containing protein n=1 Tax=Haloarchaeobius sp. HME9146 TaxID=2978732 RepID=UPI0021C0296B|nr:DUF1616 domain-containing protein [Haloarchaeobius sp. HME9146]MCT9098196.1 DUF1616 domain-containing protein [Haloarchaeobius sp. HME9146]